MKRPSQSAIILLIGTLFTRTAMFMSVPFLAIYLSNIIQLSTIEIGYIIGVNPLSNVLVSLFIGRVIDRIDLKKILIITPVCWGVIFILFTQIDTFLGFILLNGLNGMCYAIYEPATKKALSQSTAAQNKLFIFNFRYAAINIGAISGPILSVWLGFKNSIKPYAILGILYMIVGGMNFFLNNHLEKKVPIKQASSMEKKSSSKHLSFILLLLGVSCSYFGYSQFNSSIAQYLSNLGTNGVEIYSSLLSLSAIIIVIFQYPVLRLTKQRSSVLVLILSNVLFSLCLFTAISFPTSIGFILFTLFYSLAELLLGSRFDYAVDQLASEENKALYFSWSELIKLGTTVGPVVSGFLISQIGWNSYGVIFILLGFITLIGTVLLSVLERLT